MSGYTLIGFSGHLYNNAPGRMFDTRPIYLPNQEILGSFESRLPSAYAASIIIPELYKVRWVRGLDMFNIIYKGMTLFDENEKEIFFNAGPPLPENTSAFTDWLSRPNPHTNNKTPRQIMQEIEDKYPGLFIPKYVKPAASQKAPPSKQQQSPSRRRNPPSPPKTKKLSPQKGGKNKTKKL